MSTPQPTNSVPPYVFEQQGTFPGPFTYDIPATLEIRPDTATATFDGTHASGPFLACLTFYSPAGSRLSRVYNPAGVPQGGKAEVTFLPPFGSAATSASPGGSGWQFDTDPQVGDWGVVSTINQDPNAYTQDLITGNFSLRLDASDASTNGGILIYNAPSGFEDGHDSYVHLHGGRVTIEAVNAIELSAFGHTEVVIGGDTVEMGNIPTSNVGLTAGQVYRAGAAPDAFLKVK